MCLYIYIHVYEILIRELLGFLQGVLAIAHVNIHRPNDHALCGLIRFRGPELQASRSPRPSCGGALETCDLKGSFSQFFRLLRVEMLRLMKSPGMKGPGSLGPISSTPGELRIPFLSPDYLGSVLGPGLLAPPTLHLCRSSSMQSMEKHPVSHGKPPPVPGAYLEVKAGVLRQCRNQIWNKMFLNPQYTGGAYSENYVKPEFSEAGSYISS